MTQLSKLQRLVVLERTHEAHRAEITSGQADPPRWWQLLAQAEKDRLLTSLKAAQRQTRRQA
jgi:hypothetical protein